MTAFRTPHSHPSCALLMRYAAGNLSEAMQMLVASHLELCPHCRFELQGYEAQAGLGLENLPPEAVDGSCLENLLAKIDEHGPPVCIDVTLPPTQQPDARFPQPLRALTGLQGEGIEWMQGASLSQGHIRNNNVALSFMQIEAAHPLSFPQPHPARYLLVLEGTLDIGGKIYGKGDLIPLSAIRTKTTNAQTRALFLLATPAASDQTSLLGQFMQMLGRIWG